MIAGEVVATPEESEEDHGVELLTGNKFVLHDLMGRDSDCPVLKDQKELPEPTDAQIHHDIPVVTADY